MSQSPHIMDSDAMLDVYILDYLTKRKLNASRRIFEDEAKVNLNFRAIDAPRGFLCEWWMVFWDTFISRFKHHHGFMEPSNENFRVPQHQQQQGSQCHSQSQNVNASNVVTGRNTWVAEASGPMRQAIPKQWHGDSVSLLMNQLQENQSLVPAADINAMVNNLINQGAQESECLLSGAHAASGVLNNVPLKGVPLTGPDGMRARIHQQQGQGALHPPSLSYQGQNEGQSQPPNERKRSQSDGQLNHQMENMRKRPLMALSVANTSGTATVTGDCSNLAEASLPHSPHNDKINIDEYLNYGALDGNDNSQLSRPGKEADVDPSNGFTFLEIGSVHATSVNCCDISFDGKLVAVGGQDKKARLWCTTSLETKDTLDGHSQAITDIRFSPSMLRIATSSLDKTVKIWDLENPGRLIKTITGHTGPVMSIDFHPKKEDLICSCDDSETRYWNIKNAGCVKVSKGGANLVRFQSGTGKHIASVSGKSVSLLDLENNHARRNTLKGHGSNVQSLCWDSSGEHLISVSEESLKVWRMDLGGKANCIHDLSVPGKRFRCGIFHPCYPSLLIIGCYQSMELWNMAENKMMMPVEEPISALVVSGSGLVASAGHNDNVLKLWK